MEKCLDGTGEYIHHAGTPRLPTRCPACKGGLIQRMPRASSSTFISFHCLFCKNIWKFYVDDPYVNSTGELTGDVFLATRRRAKFKLGAVALHVLAEDAVKKHLDRKTTHGELERNRLARESARLAAMLRMAQPAEDRLWKILKADESNARNGEAWSVAYKRCQEVAKQIEEVQAKRQHLTSGDYFFADLPAGVASAKTDAHGRFTLSIPRRGRFGLIAHAPRELFKGKEAVYWFVWVSLDGQTSQHLTLSNDNMLGAGSLDSILR